MTRGPPGHPDWQQERESRCDCSTVCAACHGPDGKGNPALGAPNLTDDIWLYASDFDTIGTGIRMGRNGMMPAHLPIIGETRTRIAAAYVWSLSHGDKAAATAP